ncbi:MAG: single-stranded DNA-binding protein [Clostridium sp.]|nr:single-stranded DNA-binding protein [Clostridium sp.]
MNRTDLIGRLTKDAELKYTKGKGTAYYRFILAVNRQIKDKDGNREADFIPVIVWGKTAESTINYMNKGKLVGITGHIQTSHYEAKDGTRKYTMQLVATSIQFLQWTDDDKKQNTNDDKVDEEINTLVPIDDGDIPF